MKTYENQECVTEEVKRFEPQELNHDDYIHVEAEACATRGFTKGFAGGVLMALGIQMVRSSNVKAKIKPFFGGIFGATGLAAVIDSFDDWKEAAAGFIYLLRTRLKEKFRE
jgi:hypothetical protein